MYSLDVNFLNDPNRAPDRDRAAATTGLRKPPPGSMMPLIGGGALALILLAGVGGFYWYASNQNDKLTQEIAEVDTKIGEVDRKLKEVDAIIAETNKITQETKALASVFNQIKPWSAMFEDLRDRIPPNVKIDSIVQTQVAATPATAPPPANAKPGTQTPSTPTPTTKLEIRGTAVSFNDVNNFLLTLQRSSFLKQDPVLTRLMYAKLIKNGNTLEPPKSDTNSIDTKPSAPKVSYELPDMVEYRIQTSLSDVPASELVRELERKGAVGLVTRIKTLQDQRVNLK